MIALFLIFLLTPGYLVIRLWPIGRVASRENAGQHIYLLTATFSSLLYLLSYGIVQTMWEMPTPGWLVEALEFCNAAASFASTGSKWEIQQVQRQVYIFLDMIGIVVLFWVVGGILYYIQMLILLLEKVFRKRFPKQARFIRWCIRRKFPEWKPLQSLPMRPGAWLARTLSPMQDPLNRFFLKSMQDAKLVRFDLSNDVDIYGWVRSTFDPNEENTSISVTVLLRVCYKDDRLTRLEDFSAIDNKLILIPVDRIDSTEWCDMEELIDVYKEAATADLVEISGEQSIEAND